MESKIALYIASDHAGFDLKKEIIDAFKEKFEINDFGTFAKSPPVNYNEISEKLILKLQEDSPKDSISEVKNFGILICGTGTGMSIVANRFHGIRACNAIDIEQIKLARSHNNSNIICFGEKFISPSDSIKMIEAFIGEKFEGGRHINRLVFDAKKYINLDYKGEIPKQYSEIKSKLKHFECGEFEFSIQEDISNQEVFVFQSFTIKNFNNDLLKLMMVCDVLKRNNVKKISYFAPFLPYTRQDRAYDTTSSIGSKVVAIIINNCNIDEITTYDLHSLQIEGFFKGTINHLSMIPKFIEDIKSRFSKIPTIVFPDAGAASRFKRFFVNEDFNTAIINKHRIDGTIKMEILGDINSKDVVIIDDMIDSGKTMIGASKILKKNGANSIHAYATHGIFSGDAIQDLESSAIKTITVSDSIFKAKDFKKISIFNCIIEGLSV